MGKISNLLFILLSFIFLQTCRENPIDHFDPTFGKILFEIQNESPNDSLLVICKFTKIILNGESQYQILTPKNSFERDACWSPDGKKIAYVNDKDGDLYIMNADGTGRKKILDNPSNITDLSCAPDGSKIVYSKMSPGRNSIYSLFIYDLTLQMEKPVNINLPETGYYSLSPTWSPDASKIAFVYFKNGLCKIYTVDLISEELKLVYDTGDESITSLDWSPDGKFIAFSVFKFLDGGTKGNVVGGIQIINPDGRNLQKITGDNNLDVYPSWSPDGTKIVFCRYVGGLPNATRFSIHILDITKMNEYEILSSNKDIFAKTRWARSK